LLLDHLSLRLLSLPQTTVLPGVPACLRHERTENEVESEMFGASAYLNRKILDSKGDMEATRTDHDYSLEELYQLLDLVQNELDSMRSNPEMGLRGHYIDRLTRLEERMQNFHECISQKLSDEKGGGASARLGDGEEVCDAIASVLAPYRDEPGSHLVDLAAATFIL
uniref:Plectin b n=1 Tax=Heligmosomoides polygyrus TaxID=6339 RepID=A0A183F785_HELPZ